MAIVNLSRSTLRAMNMCNEGETLSSRGLHFAHTRQVHIECRKIGHLPVNMPDYSSSVITVPPSKTRSSARACVSTPASSVIVVPTIRGVMAVVTGSSA